MINRLPIWFRQDIPDAETFKLIKLFSEFGVHTVCQEAKCPNLSYCFKNKKVTFMILGESCTRNCGFCNVAKLESSGQVIDGQEPYKISQLVRMLGLDYCVITSVTRDDLPDGGSAQFSKTIGLIRGINNNIKIEVLIPDFAGKLSSLECVLNAGPDLAAHNIETVKRLYSDLRPKADYGLSLGILAKIKELKPNIFTKSAIMLGLGEKKEELLGAMEDLKASGCDILVLGQYLAPTPEHYPVKEFIGIEQFKEYREIGLGLGFKAVLSEPKARSSYNAEELEKTPGLKG